MNQMFIKGQFTSGHAKQMIPVINPATEEIVSEVKAGTIWINDPLTDNFAGPFGGMKMSGLGRELGQAGFEEFVQLKHVHWDFDGGLKEYWYPYGK